MDKVNYIEINIDLFLKNIDYVIRKYNYSNYIFDVSNNAFNHGMYLINYLGGKINYLYVNNIKDLLLIRKYNKQLYVVYDGLVTEDNIYDLIINNAIVVIHNMDILNMIKELNIKDVLSFIIYVDSKGLFGIRNKNDILNYLEWNNKYFKLIGVMGVLEEKDYEEFKYIIRPISNLDLVILNNEFDKRKINSSNTILLDKSLYGINNFKNGLFKKNSYELKQIFSLYSKILNVKKIKKNKKDSYIAIIPFGYKHGFIKNIKFVYINNKLYPVKEILDEFVIVEVDTNIKKDMLVEITSVNNPLENYIKGDTLNYFSFFSSNIPILFDNYILEKEAIY